MTKDEFTKEYLSEFNEQQKNAVYTVDGPVLLLAVPGSGKTTVLVARLGYMMKCCGIVPENILTMTYTVAATREMKQRFGDKYGSDFADRTEFRTINGISAIIISYYGKYYARKKPFELEDNEANLSGLIGRLYREINNDFATESTIKDVRTEITYVKNMMLTDEEISKYESGIDNFPDIYKQYNLTLHGSGFMDYDDQMVYALQILNSVPEVLRYFTDRYQYLCVDEAQDTSKIQHEIIKKLAADRRNLFMVGDEDQSIYGFRAAFPEALIKFEETYADAKVLLMEENFRSNENIVAAANSFVKKNRFRHDKTLRASRPAGEQIKKVTVPSRIAQYKYIYALAKRGTENFAVLFRNNDSILPLVDMFDKDGISFNCRNHDNSFFSNRVIADYTDIIRLANNPLDSEAFMRVYYKMGAGITKVMAEAAVKRSSETGDPIVKCLLRSRDLKPYTVSAIENIITSLKSLTTDDASISIRRVQHSLNYNQYAEKNQLDTGKLDILSILAEDCSSPAALLSRLDELNVILQTHENDSGSKVILSTIHSSKGLEYDSVYLLDAIDGILPSIAEQDVENDSDTLHYEEERRIYYVGITRAKNSLYLFDIRDEVSSFNKEIFKGLKTPRVDSDDMFSFEYKNMIGKYYHSKSGKTGHVVCQCDGTFLIQFTGGELRLMTLEECAADRNPVPELTESRHSESAKIIPRISGGAFFPADPQDFTEGSRINHSTFGAGSVITNENDCLTVVFDNDGRTRKFLLSVALKNGNVRILH